MDKIINLIKLAFLNTLGFCIGYCVTLCFLVHNYFINNLQAILDDYIDCDFSRVELIIWMNIILIGIYFTATIIVILIVLNNKYLFYR